MTKADVNLLIFQGYMGLVYLGALIWVLCAFGLLGAGVTEWRRDDVEWKSSIGSGLGMLAIAAFVLLVIWYQFLPDARIAQ